jgi:hypothetical protein
MMPVKGPWFIRTPAHQEGSLVTLPQCLLDAFTAKRRDPTIETKSHVRLSLQCPLDGDGPYAPSPLILLADTYAAGRCVSAHPRRTG